MSKKDKFYSSARVSSVLLVLTVIAAILFRSSKSNWVFINTTLGIEKFSVLLITLMAALCIILAAITLINKHRTNTSKNKAFRAVSLATIILSVISFIFAVAYSIGLVTSESSEVFFLTLSETLGQGALLIVVPFFVLFFPSFSCKCKKSIATVLLVLTLVLGINSFFPLAPYKITSTPMVIDNGKEYSIVFSTNDAGTAYAEYSYNGKEYKVFDNTGGRLNSNKKIHSISVPYEHLRNNTYKVGSTRVIEEFSYGSRTGKNVSSAEYKFEYNESKNQKWLVVSDWHTMLDTAYTAIDKLESDYDAVILLGDASPGVDFEQQVITNTVQFGGKVSKGSKPVLYVRGNHETRGAYAKDLPVALGIDEFYYTADIGPYSFVVLDSGEDKDDSHIEYGGMNDYNTYRADMIEWLKGVEVKNDKVIALSHAWQISAVEPELSAEGWQQLERIGTRLILSGHEHRCAFIGDKNDKEKEIKEKYPDIIGYIDGGKSKENYTASLLTLNENSFDIRAVDNNGTEIINEIFKW